MTMTGLGAFTETAQLDFADVLAEFRDVSPQKGVPPVEIGPDPELQVATECDEIGTEPHDGLCPYTRRCEARRRLLSTYREHVKCHWQTWGNWKRCPIYRRNGG